MLWSRGLFRLWLVLSSVWLIIWAVVIYQNFPSKTEDAWYLGRDGSFRHGNIFDDEALQALKDGKEQKINGFSIIVPSVGSPSYNAWRGPNLPPLPEGAVLIPPEAGLASWAQEEYRNKLSNNVYWPLEIGTGIPAIVFVLGAALIWAFRGFRADPPNRAAKDR